MYFIMSINDRLITIGKRYKTFQEAEAALPSVIGDKKIFPIEGFVDDYYEWLYSLGYSTGQVRGITELVIDTLDKSIDTMIRLN